MKYRWRGAVVESAAVENLETIDDLKYTISSETGIPYDRLKLLGIKARDGGRVDDGTMIKDCLIPPSGFTVIGTPATEQLSEEAEDEDTVADATSYNSKEKNERCTQLWTNEVVQRRFRRVSKHISIAWLRPPDPGKKLLVLDLDYTIFDCKHLRESQKVDIKRIRPYLKHMFDILSPHYNYAIWSQTKWQWVDFKCVEIGMYSSEKTLPCFTLDKTSMFVVPSEVNKEVKCLQLIWDKCDGLWNASSTLHVDDLSRNFLLNPRNGVKITPYKRALFESDRELLRLSKYLLHVATLPDVRALDHSAWKEHSAASL